MTVLSRRGLLKLARNNQIPATLRYNWQQRCGFDPIVAAYEAGAQIRAGARALAGWAALLVLVVLSPNFLPFNEKLTNFAGLLMAIAGFVFLILHWQQVDQQRWNGYRVTDFPDDLVKFAQLHSWHLGGLVDFSQERTRTAVCGSLIKVAREVVSQQRLCESQRLEDKHEFANQVAQASDRFKQIFEISSKFSLTDKDGFRYYYREAEKQLGPVKSGLDLIA